MLVTWDDFNRINKLNKKDAFEQLVHYLFLNRYGIPPWKIKRHSNQAGIEVEPIKVEIEGGEVFASYQAKHFDSSIDWQQCKKSIEVAVKRKREGDYADLERIDFYLNKNTAQNNQMRDKIEKIASGEGIAIHWHYGEEILLEVNHPSAGDELKAITTKFFTKSELGRQIRIPKVDAPPVEVVGRSEFAAEIKQALRDHQRVQLFGLPGVGKSTLASYVVASEEAMLGAVIVSARDLSGAQGSEAVEQQVQLLAEKAVSKFVKGQIEGDALELAKDLFRSDKRLLVIDNLEAPELVRSFIEKIRPARLILTSRRDATCDLVEGVSFRVDELSPDAAREQFYNDSRLNENCEREAVDEICSLLGYLPLAINLLAVQMGGYFDGSPEEALNVLRQKRLEYLERYGDFSRNSENSLRLCFELSYEHLRPEQKHIFQVMGALMSSGANLASIVYMSGLEEFPVKRALAELKQRSLVNLSEENYSLHTLLWEYAREKLAAESDLNALKVRALQLIHELLEGYESETRSVDLELYELYWEQAKYLTVRAQPGIEDFLGLADATYQYLTQTSQYWEALSFINWILANVRMWGNRYSEVVCLDMQGNVYQNLGFYQQAVNVHEKALELAEKHKLRDLEGTIFGNLGNGYQYVTEYERALDCHRQSAEIAREVGNKRGEGAAIGNQAIALRALGKPEEAFELAVTSLFIARTINYRKGEMSALANYANAVSSVYGDVAARKYYEEALQIAESLKARSMQASLLRNIGRADQGLGNYEKALDYFKQSFNMAGEIGDSLEMIQALGSMGEVSLSMDEPEKALERHSAALEAAREIGSAEQEGVQLDCLGCVYRALGDFEKALSCHTKALAIFERINYHRGISAATGNMGHVYRSEGKITKVFEQYFSSLTASVENHYWEGIGQSLTDLGNILAELGEFRYAVTFWIAACPILKREREAYYFVIATRLSDMREKWREFDEFTKELVSGTRDPVIESVREVGFLETISQEYVQHLIGMGASQKPLD